MEQFQFELYVSQIKFKKIIKIIFEVLLIYYNSYSENISKFQMFLVIIQTSTCIFTVK
jgi:hypothetical protein